MANVDLHRLAQAMCSIDLAESHWTQELPRLSVPDLWLTVGRYLGSLKAVLAPSDSLDEMLNNQIGCKLTADRIRSNWWQYERTDHLVKQFMLNEGPELQRDLKEYANKGQNWATEYWLQDMYLSNPLPLPVNSNPFFMFPRQRFATSDEMLMFATRVIQFSVDFKYRIDQQALRQDFGSGHGKGKPLCMETYKNFFHSYRMPHEAMDRLLPQSRRSNHIVVASCNQFYILRLGQDPLDNPYRKDTSSQMNESSIFDQLLRIYRVSREHAKRELLLAAGTTTCRRKETEPSHCGRIPRVGLFTTENRKTWAKIHKRLSHCNATTTSEQSNQSLAPSGCRSRGSNGGGGGGAHSPNTNTESLRQIEDCLFVMCLDSLVGPAPHQAANRPPDARSSAPNIWPTLDQLSDVEAANIILTGGGTHLFTANRWFDKFLQIIVGRNGICGINIEHSASEGITVLRFLEEFLEYLRSNPLTAPTRQHMQPQAAANKFTYDQEAHRAAGAPADAAATGSLTADSITSPTYVEPMSPSALLEESDKITPLMWHLDEELMGACEQAELAINGLIANFSLFILNFDHFGRAFIKSQNLSPDAFVQLALQYTFYKLHGHLVSTYESASLRQFRLGRVDNIRANTCETYQWIQAMLTCKQDHQQQRAPPATNEQPARQNEQRTRAISFQRAQGPFSRAISKQVEILRYTIVGGAPDNHLLALKELAKIRYGQDELPELFTDPSYREFLNFRLSTSQLPNESGIVVGYGAVVPDGYGCSYNPCESRIVFCISSFVDCPETSSSKFAQVLQESLLEMQQLCLERARSPAPAATTNTTMSNA